MQPRSMCGPSFIELSGSAIWWASLCAGIAWTVTREGGNRLRVPWRLAGVRLLGDSPRTGGDLPE